MNSTLKLVLFATFALIHGPPPAFSFISIPLMDKECKSTWNIIKICPRYCASKHPGRLLWGLACICCKIQETTSGTTTARTSTVRTKPTTEIPSTTVSSLDTLRMLLEQLKEENRLPPVEADNWIARLSSVNKTLLTLDEQIVLTNLLLRAGVPWQTIFTLLRPISEAVPVSKRPPSSVKPVTGKPTTQSDEVSTPTTSDNPASLPSAASGSTAPEPSTLPTAETESTAPSSTSPTTVSKSTISSSTASKVFTIASDSTTTSTEEPEPTNVPTTESDSDVVDSSDTASTDELETTTV